MTEKYRNTPKGRIAPNGYRLCDPLPEGHILVDNEKKQWVIGKPIGCGGFGEIYICFEKNDPKLKNYVMKLDNISGPLFVEVNFVLRACQKTSINLFMEQRGLTFLGIPRFHASGTHQTKNGSYRFLIMERLGEELQKVLEKYRISVRVTCRIACRIIDVLEYIHDQGYIHADIKAQNILRAAISKCDQPVRKNSKIVRDDEVYEDDKYCLIDYGLAERYTLQGVHKPYEMDKRKANNGTCEFRSRDAHIGVISRRSDIESLGFNLILWFYGRHPWVNMLKNADQVHDKKCWAMKNINDFLIEAFSDKPLSNSDTSNSKTSKSSSKSQPEVVINKNIPLNTTPVKSFNKFFEEVNLLAHDARPNYQKFKDILYEIARLNTDSQIKKSPVKSTKKKLPDNGNANLPNKKTAKGNKKLNESIEVEDDVDSVKPKISKKRKELDHQPINGNNGRVKRISPKNSKNGYNFCDEDDDDDTEEDEEVVEIKTEFPSERSSLRTKNGAIKKVTNGSKLSRTRKSISSSSIKVTKNVKQTSSSKLQSRTQRTRINKTDQSSNELGKQEKKVKQAASKPNVIKKTPRRAPRLSTPLIMMTPPDGGDSPLFGPFEPDDSIKENRDLVNQSGQSNNLSSFLSQTSDDEDTQDRQLRSCRIYINNKRCHSRQSPLHSEDDNLSHHKNSYQLSSIVSPDDSLIEEDIKSALLNHKVNNKRVATIKPAKVLKQNGVKKPNEKSNGHIVSSSASAATKSTATSKRNKMMNSSDRSTVASSPLISNKSAPISTVPIVETPAMQRIRLIMEKRKQTPISTKK